MSTEPNDIAFKHPLSNQSVTQWLRDLEKIIGSPFIKGDATAALMDIKRALLPVKHYNPKTRLPVLSLTDQISLTRLFAIIGKEYDADDLILSNPNGLALNTPKFTNDQGCFALLRDVLEHIDRFSPQTNQSDFIRSWARDISDALESEGQIVRELIANTPSDNSAQPAQDSEQDQIRRVASRLLDLNIYPVDVFGNDPVVRNLMSQKARSPHPDP